MTIKEKTSSDIVSSIFEPELLKKVQQLAPAKLQWLSGYCAGLAENLAEPLAASFVSPATLSEQQSDSKVLVLYASQTGNAETLAAELSQRLQAENIPVTLNSTLDIKLKTLTNFSSIVIVASTHGEGEPPDDAIDFHEAIFSKKAPKLAGVQHAVLGLGDSSYEFFCQTAKDFDSVLSKLGSQALLQRQDCDVDYQADAQNWIQQLIEKLKTIQPQKQELASTSIIPLNNKSEQLYSKNNPFKAAINATQKITGRDSVKDTYHLEIDLADSGIHYQPGDALGVWADNNQQLVDEILQLQGFTAEQPVHLNGEDISIQEALTKKLELTLLNKQSLKQLADITQSEALTKIIDEAYSDYIKNHQWIDVLHLSNAQLSAQQLVDLLKPIKPRLYSIASSLDETPEEVHITLNHVRASNEYAERYGLASHYLTQELTESDELNIYIDRNKNFKLPADDKDLIMIGPGTGIAPFRAFLQQREINQAIGKNWLFFGNPHFNTDFLYQVELQKFLHKGVLNKIDLAFSRDQEEKVYVQHKLLEQADRVWQWLEAGAYVYVCGDMQRMAKDVENALLLIIQQQGRKTPEQAKNYLKQLKQESRYQRDVY